MIIGPPRLTTDGACRLLAPITDRSGTTRDLWFEVPLEYEALVSDRCDAALVALLLPAMRRGDDIDVRGPVTDTLLHALAGDVQVLRRTFTPTLSPVGIHAPSTLPPESDGRHVAAGFSGGIDSYAMIREFHGPQAPTGQRLDLLLFTNVGSHGDGGARLFRDRAGRVSAAAADLGLPLLTVDSNLDDFYAGMTYESTHVMRNAAVAFLLRRGLRTWLHASTFQLSHVSVSPDHYEAYIEPLLLGLLSSGELHLRSVCGQYTRVEKTQMVADMPSVRQFLDICTSVDGGTNCGTCIKCVRALYTLELLGEQDQFDGVFDLAAYREVRHRAVARVLAGARPLDVEIASLRRASRGHLGSRTRVLRHWYRARRRAAALYRRLRPGRR